MPENDATWIVYHVGRNDVLHRVAADTTLSAPVAGMPHLTRLSMPHRGRPGHAFTPEDGIVLDALTAAIEGGSTSLLGRLLDGKPVHTLFVGRETHGGVCHLYFHGERDLPKRQLVSLERLAPGRAFEVASRPDPEWRFYRDELHPGPALSALLLSQAQLDQRREHGDDLARERDVDHTLLFPTEAAREAFLSAVGQQGRERLFEMPEERTGRPFGVEVKRTHTLAPAVVDMHILHLSSHANVHGGTYDGWGAPELAGCNPNEGK